MTPLRIAVAVLVALLVLMIGGCIVFGTGSSDAGDLPTTPTQTTP